MSSFRLFSHYNGSIFGTVRNSIRYNVNNALGNRTSLDQSEVKRYGSHRTRLTRSIFVLVCQKNPRPQVQDSDKEIPFQIGTDPLNSLFALGAECSKKLSDTERVTFRIGVFLIIIIKKSCRTSYNKCEQKGYPIWLSGHSYSRSDIV